MNLKLVIFNKNNGKISLQHRGEIVYTIIYKDNNLDWLDFNK